MRVNKYIVSGLWFGKNIKMEILSKAPGGVWFQANKAFPGFDIESIEFQGEAKRSNKNEFNSANDNTKR